MNKKTIKSGILTFFAIYICCYLSFSSQLKKPVYNKWHELEPGLEFGLFLHENDLNSTDSSKTIYILRIDPKLWDLTFKSKSAIQDGTNFSAKEWCEKFEMVAAINGGMYDTDIKTHVGYCKIGDHINNSKWNKYQSVAAFDPKVKSQPGFTIFDRDKSESIEHIEKNYSSIVQNLRLIKNPRENRWQQQDRRWSETALGEDSNGRILFIFTRYPYTMHDFNNILLDLPIDIVAAQHLDGGPPAQVYVKTDEFEIDLCGSFETKFFENDDNKTSWKLPFVFGIVPKMK